MRAVRAAPPGVELVEVDEPEGPSELLEIHAAGICASDFLYIGLGSQQLLGHELAGTMADGTAVGAIALTSWGDFAFGDPMQPSPRRRLPSTRCGPVSGSPRRVSTT